MTEDIILSLLGIFGTVLSLVIGLAADAARKRWGIEIEAKHREALHSAVMTAAGNMIRDMDDAENSRDPAFARVHARDAAIDYVRRSVPDAIAALSPAPDVLDRLVMSTVGKIITERTK